MSIIESPVEEEIPVISEIDEVLIKAEQILIKKRWVRNKEITPKGVGVCLIGAVKLALGGTRYPQGIVLLEDAELGLYNNVRDRLSKVIYDDYKYLSTPPVEAWNDKIAKSKREVLDVLKRARNIQ